MSDKFHNLILNQKLFLGLTVIAFWIKFNIVFFTYKPYTATKFYFPIYAFFVLAHLLQQLKNRLWNDHRFQVLAAFALFAFIPVGYLDHAHEWGLYRAWGLSLFSYLVLYLSATFLLAPFQKKYIVLGGYLFCVIAALYCLVQYYFHWSYSSGHFRNDTFSRPFGILDDPDHTSGLYLIGFSLSLWGIFYRKKYLFWLLPLAVVFILSIVISLSAGAVLALLGSGTVFLLTLLLLSLKDAQIKSIFTALVTLWSSAFLAMILFFVAYKSDFMGVGRLLRAYKGDATISTRLDLMLLAKNIIFQNPLFGTGLGNDMNTAIYARYHTAEMIYSEPFHIHTTLLSSAATIGVLGTLFLIGVTLYSILEFAKLFSQQEAVYNRFLILLLFSTFMVIQIQSYSLLMLYSISYWFSLILPFLFGRLLSPSKDGHD
jgi:hypothetical protein